MSWLETVRSGLEAIAGHRLRSALTALGILIGVAAVIVTVGIGEGASSSVSAAISSLGTNLLIVSPGSTTTGLVRGGFGTASTLTYADAVALANKKDCPDISGVAPQLQRAETLVAGSQNWTTTVIGSTTQWLSVRDRTMAQGSFFDEADVKQDANVIVLGETTAQYLGLFDPVGQTVDVGNLPFTVIGVLTSAGSSSSSSNEDDLAVVPITTAEELLSGSSSLTSIYLQAASQSVMGAAYYEATDDLLELHGITDPANADFTITTQSSLLSTKTQVDNTLAFVLTGIAAISLLVGGIGVMNIMLVSVTERVKEIGLRKAVGATPNVILRQFLVEATALGLIGGIVGAGLGLIADVLIPALSSSQVAISPTAIVLAVGVSMLIGIGFGAYPAYRAARLAPIEALRSE
ncbi:MAG TPA: ABC transporter permease [Acidimicrobiales bacterium]|nr:ABC transporter permease [Acidimicrobiales bacterium]